MSKPLTLSQRLSLRAYASDEECRTDDADIMREADEALSAKDDEIERLRASLAWVRVNYASAPTQQINAHIDAALNGGSDAP